MAFDIDKFIAEPEPVKSFDINAFIANAPRGTTPSLEGVLRGRPFDQELDEAQPFAGAGNQFNQGFDSGIQLVGDNLAGATLGTILGGARAAGTALNPVGVVINSIPRYAQAGGSYLGDKWYGNNSGTAINDLLGGNPIQSGAAINPKDTGIPLIDIPLNSNINVLNEIAKQPMILASMTPKALGVQGGALRSAGTAISDTLKAAASPRLTLAKTLGREPVPILSNVLDYTASQSDKIRNVINKSPELLPEIKSNLSPTRANGGENAISAIGKTIDNRYDIYYPAVEQAPEAVINRNLGEGFKTKAIARIKEDLSDSGISKDRQAELIAEMTPEIDSVNQGTLINSTKLLNRQTSPLFKPNPTPSALANDQMIARLALRDVQSEAIHGILKDSGIDPKVYSEIGLLHEFQSQLSKKYLAAKNDLNKTLGSSLNQAARKGLKQGLTAGIVETGERALTKKTGGKVGEIDRAMNLLFDQIEASNPTFRTVSPIEELLSGGQSGENFLP